MVGGARGGAIAAGAARAFRGGALRLDMGAKLRVDTIVVTNFDAPFDLAALGPASVSADLKTWTPVTMSAREKVLTVRVPSARAVRVAISRWVFRSPRRTSSAIGFMASSRTT